MANNGWVGFPAVTSQGTEFYSLVVGTGSNAALWWWNYDAKIYSVNLLDTSAADVPDGVTVVTAAVGNGPGGLQSYNQEWCYDAATDKVWAVYYDTGVNKLAEIDPSDGSFTGHAVSDVDRCWIDGSGNLWIRRDTDKSVLERIDKASPTSAALESREFNVNTEFVIFIDADAYVVDQNTLTFRWFPEGGSLQTLAITSSAGYLRFITHDTTNNALWIMTGPTTGDTHYLHKFSLSSGTQVDDVTLTNRVTQSAPIFYRNRLYFGVSYSIAYQQRELVSMSTADKSFRIDVRITNDVSGITGAMVLHPNGSFYFNASDGVTGEQGMYRIGMHKFGAKRPKRYIIRRREDDIMLGSGPLTTEEYLYWDNLIDYLGDKDGQG